MGHGGGVVSSFPSILQETSVGLQAHGQSAAEPNDTEDLVEVSRLASLQFVDAVETRMECSVDHLERYIMSALVNKRQNASCAYYPHIFLSLPACAATACDHSVSAQNF